jgi:hypothetical protein
MPKAVVILFFTLLSVGADAQADAHAYVLLLKAQPRVLDRGAAAAGQVARPYAGQPVPGDGALAGQYMLKVSASRARMMSADHRVARLTPPAARRKTSWAI